MSISAIKRKLCRSLRPSARARGYDRAYEQLRKEFLSDPENRLCVECVKLGRLVLATEADHIISVRDRPDLRLEKENLQPLCKRHHSRKTVRSDGGFGK